MTAGELPGVSSLIAHYQGPGQRGGGGYGDHGDPQGDPEPYDNEMNKRLLAEENDRALLDHEATVHVAPNGTHHALCACGWCSLGRPTEYAAMSQHRRHVESPGWLGCVVSTHPEFMPDAWRAAVGDA